MRIRSTFFFLFFALLGLAAHGQRLRDPAVGDWSRYGLDEEESRFSPLSQIDTANVSRLELGWALDLGPGGAGQEATPLVANGTIYAITNWSVVIAADARTGKQKWRWDPEVNRDATRRAICCGVVNRGLALYGDLVIAPIIDGRLQALDSTSGKPAWEARVAFSQDHYTLTMAPRVAGDKVIIGVSGGDQPTRGFVDAYDARTGRRVWRFYTVPGDPSMPFENDAMRRAAATWDREWWKLGGGGAVWDGLAYDSREKLVYVGTGNPEPWAHQHRSSKEKENLYTSSILAIDADSGKLRWYYQVVPGDNWDFDSVQQLTLADLMINGRSRKVVMQASKNGFFYVLDRVTGAFISAEPFVPVSWARGIDRATGRPMINPDAYYDGAAVLLAPGIGGGHNWPPMSYSPRYGLMYVPAWYNVTSHAAQPTLVMEPRNMTGTVRPNLPPAKVLVTVGPKPIQNEPRALIAWDPSAQKVVWRAPGAPGVGGGTLATAGNLVFWVEPTGQLHAYSADKGERLLDLDTGLRSGLGPPITFLVDGKQHLAVMGGVGTVAVSDDVGPGRVSTPSNPKLLVFAIK